MAGAATAAGGARRRAARAAFHTAIAACLVGFASWLVIAATPTIKKSAAIKEGLAFSSLSGSNTFVVLLTWATLLAATLLTLALRRFLPASSSTPRGSLRTQIQHALAWQLPPRSFWANWSGGLSAGEAAGVAGWLFVNAWWLGMLTKRSLKRDEPALEQLETVAKNFGKMMAPNLMLLFLPIPHLSFITWLTGVSRNQLVRYHRWLGHGTLWVLTIHGLLYYIYWGASREFWVEFSDWGPKVNNLCGSLAYFFCLALWLTSLSSIRRRMYQLFFRFHIVCFLGFFLFGCAHYTPVWSYFAPGLLLYAADLVLRAGQMANVTAVAAAAVDERSETVTLQLKADAALEHRPPSEVWVQLPEISRWQWHPFTVAGGEGSLLTLHIKRYGAFTKSLVDGLRRRTVTAVRVAGPNGAGEATLGCQLSPPASWRKYDTVVMVGGGIGITGLLSMLRSMAAAHAAGAVAGLPRRVRCVWVARCAGEFSSLDAPLLLAATAAKGWLELRLHLTGGSGSAAVKAGPPGGIQLALTSSGSFKDGDGDSSVGKEDGESAPLMARGASPFLFNRFRPVQPQSLGAAHLAAVYLLAYLGAFAGLLLAASYASQVAQWKGGMLHAVLMSALALGLPFGLAVFPAHAFRYWRYRRAARLGDESARGVVPFGLSGALADNACVAGEDAVRFGDATLRVLRGRPDIPSELHAAAAEASGTVGVYVAGPHRMMTSVHLTVSKLNSEARRAGSPRFELHREAVEL